MPIKIPYTLSFMPNGQHSPMHIGHLWLMTYMRTEYDNIRKNTNLFDVRWELFIDGSYNHYTDNFEKDMTYLGWAPDSVHYFADWHHACMRYLSWCHQEFSYGARYGDASPLLLKLLYFKECGVKRHYRGTDIASCIDKEQALAKMIGWSCPQMVIIPVLSNESGDKIGDPAGTSPEYLIETYREKGIPGAEVIERLKAYVGEPRILLSDSGIMCLEDGLNLNVSSHWFS